MRCLHLVVVRRRNSKIEVVVTPKPPEVFERELSRTRGWRGAKIFDSSLIRLSNGEAKLVGRLFELSSQNDALDFNTFKNLLAKFGRAGFFMLPPPERKRHRPRK